MLFALQSKNHSFNHKMRLWRKQAVTWWLLTLACVFVTPFLAMRLQYQIAPDIVESWLAAFSIAYWPVVYITVLFLLLLLIELLSLKLIKSHSMQYPAYIDKMVAKLAQKAGISPIPRVIFIEKTDFLNAGALRSFMYGRKVILFGSVEKLDPQQLEAVIAHEMAHLVMRDVWFSQFARAMLTAVKMVNRLTFLALAISFFGSSHDLTWFLAGTFLITGLGSSLAKQCYLKYSRICEYRADGIAAELTTPAHRQHLVDALRVVREMSFIALLKKRELDEIDSGTHPTIRNRAKELGAKYFSAGLARMR